MTFYRVPFMFTVARNMCVNGSFEGSSATYGWEADANATSLAQQPRVDGTVPPYGRFCLQWAPVAAGDSSIRTVVTTPGGDTPLGFMPGDFHYKFQARKSVAAQAATGIQVKVTFYTSADAVIGVPAWVAAAGALTHTAWLDVEGSITIPASAVKFQVAIRAVGASTSGGIRIDGVIFATADVDYFDGDTANVLGAAVLEDNRFHYWTGAPHASESVQTYPGTSDVVTADVDALPFEAARETRSAVGRLLESDATRVTYIPPGPRAGTYRAVFADPLDALAALSWFASSARFAFHRAAPSHADMLFTVAEGTLSLATGEAGDTVVNVPFVESL
jgi:hypothetical protein